MKKRIGVLALQGDFERHEEMLRSLGAATVQVRKADDLEGCDALVIPGGESTTLTKLMGHFSLHVPIREFAADHPVMGTCAGMIMIASEVDDERVDPLGLIEMAVDRNAYGRQIDSFVTPLDISRLGEVRPFRAIFIRAPRIRRIDGGVETLVEHEGRPVMVRNGKVLAVAFHPELAGDPRIHQYFLERFCRDQ